MDFLSKIGYLLVVLIFLIPAFQAIFEFFGLSKSIYLPYLIWITVLFLFYGFLPERVGEMFME